MTLVEAITVVVAAALIGALFMLVRLATRIGRAADDVAVVARRVAELTPDAREVIANGRPVQAGTVTPQLLRGFESEVADRYRAHVAGTRADFGMLRRFWGGNGSHGSQSAGVEQFDRLDS